MNTSIDGYEEFEETYGDFPKGKIHLAWVPSHFTSNMIYGAVVGVNEVTVRIAFVSGKTLSQIEVPYHNLLMIEYVNDKGQKND